VIQKTFQILAIVFCISWIAKEAIIPGVTYLLLKDQYIEQVSSCANAMDEAWFLEQSGEPSLIDSSSIQLLACHDYDKNRKLLLMSGLSENTLSYLGLEALELGQQSAERLTLQHRFKTR
jgi:His-Xaa-Ser system protein (TIGR03982 family)